MPPKKTIALFDFDGTLMKGDSFVPFLFSIHGTFSALTMLSIASPILIKAGIKKGMDGMKEKFIELFFGDFETALFYQPAKDLFDKYIHKRLIPQAIEKLKWHQSEGHTVVICSASPDVYMNKVAEKLNVDLLVCTKLEQKGGIYTGKYDGKNCNFEQKVVMLKEKINFLDYDEIYAYGNAPGDKEMLKMAHKSFYRCYI